MLSSLYDKWANRVNYCISYLAVFLFTSVYSSASHWQCNSQINYQHFNLPFKFYAYGHGLRHMFHKCLKDRFPRWHCHIVPWSGPKVRFGHSVSHRCMKIQEVFPCLSSQQMLILSLLNSCCSSFFRKGTLYKSYTIHLSNSILLFPYVSHHIWNYKFICFEIIFNFHQTLRSIRLGTLSFFIFYAESAPDYGIH